MVSLVVFFAACLVSSALSSCFTVWLLADRIGARRVGPASAPGPGVSEPGPPSGKLHRPVYNTPEKAALSELARERRLPPQWGGRPTGDSTFTRIPTDR